MRRPIGWMMFILAAFVVRTALADSTIIWYIAAAWWVAGVALLCGWYALAIRPKPEEGDVDAE